jgi:hypothetical protein
MESGLLESSLSGEAEQLPSSEAETSPSGEAEQLPSSESESSPSSEGPLDQTFSYINVEFPENTFDEPETSDDPELKALIDSIKEDSNELKSLDEEYSRNFELLGKDAQQNVVRQIGEGLKMSTPTPETIKTELEKPENIGVFAKISRIVKNVLRKVGISKDKKRTKEIKENLKTKLDSEEFSELKRNVESAIKSDTNNRRDVIDYLFDSIVEQGKTSQEIVQELTRMSNDIRDEQELYNKLSELRFQILSDAVNEINLKTQNDIELIQREIARLITDNDVLRTKLEEISKREGPVISTSDDKLTNQVALLSKQMEELKTSASGVATQKEIDNLSQQVKNLQLGRVLLRELDEDANMPQPPRWTPIQPQQLASPQPPRWTPVQPQQLASPQPPRWTPIQPQQLASPQQAQKEKPSQKIATKQEIKPTKESSEQVISISPEQLLDNKTIVIKIMMPRGAQIDTASDTGNTADEQISSVINLSGKDKEVHETQTLSEKDKEVQQGAEKLKEATEIINYPPPPYRFGGGKKSMDPARVHPASLF